MGREKRENVKREDLKIEDRSEKREEKREIFF
jgi:hypothetical protein